jgi:glycosyltransferase involved in cell wall biosynthesis
LASFVYFQLRETFVNDGIILVTPWLHDGGIERNLEVKAPWLASRGYRVAVAAWQLSPTLSGATNPVFRTLHEAGIPVIDLFVPGARHELLASARRLAALCTERHIDVIVGHETLGNAVALLAKVLLRGRCRVVAEFHNAVIYPTPGFGRVMAACVRQLYRTADEFLAVSSALGEEVADFFRLRRPVHTIYNPFRPEKIRVLAAQAPDLALPAEPFIAASGRLVKAKGFEDLIRALSAVRAHRRLKLVIIGEGPERAALEACAREHGVEDDVLMPGYLENPFAVFARAAAFVVSSRYGEAFSRVLVEAMACGVPVIASRCRWGPEEVLRGGRYGRLYDVGDVAQLAAALEETLADPRRSEAIVAEASRRVSEFSEEAILPRLEHVYFGQQPRRRWWGRLIPAEVISVAARVVTTIQ